MRRVPRTSRNVGVVDFTLLMLLAGLTLIACDYLDGNEGGDPSGALDEERSLWKTWSRDNLDVSFTDDDRIKTSGTHSLKIESRNLRENSYITDDLVGAGKLVKGSTYELSARVKSEIDGYWDIRLESIASDGDKITEMEGERQGGIHDWRQVQIVFHLPTDIKDARLHLKTQGPGRIWFDDIRIRPFTRTERVIRDQSREFGLLPSSEYPLFDPDVAATASAGRPTVWRVHDTWRAAARRLDERGISLHGTIGETLRLFLALTNVPKSEPVSLSLHSASLSGPELKSWTFGAGHIRFWPQLMRPTSTTLHTIPELLVEQREIPLVADEPNLIYGHLTIPPTARSAPDDFILRIRGESYSIDVPLSVTIFSYRLEAPTDHVWGIYTDDWRWSRFSDSELLRELNDLRNSGFQSLVINPVRREDVRLSGTGEVLFSLADFERKLRLIERVGFNGPIVLSTLGIDNWLTEMKADVPKSYNQFLMELKRTIQPFARSLDLYVHVYDEPNIAAQLKTAQTYLECARRLGLKTFTTAWISSSPLLPLLDIVSFREPFAHSSKRQVDQLKGSCATSRTAFWTYGSGCYPGQEGKMNLNRWLAGFLEYRIGSRGHFSWTFQRPRGDPESDIDQKDLCIVYPGRTKGTIRETLQWIGILEGITDYAYYHTFEHALTRLEQAHPREDADWINRSRSEAQARLERLGWLYEKEVTSEELQNFRIFLGQSTSAALERLGP
jgi:hypothetical protein